MHFSYALAAALLAAGPAQTGFIAMDYWPDSNDCTGRKETLEVNGGTCNTGNVIHSYAVTACDSVSYLNIYIDGSACSGDLAGYAYDPCEEGLNVCKSASAGGGSVYAGP